MQILEKKPSELLNDFLNDYNELFKIDIEKSKIEIKKIIDFYSGEKNDCASSVLEKRWYDSIKINQPDYSIYGDDSYFMDIWCCFKMYSRNYIRVLNSRGALVQYYTKKSIVDILLQDTKSIIDVGCGIGYSTAILKELFPYANVYAYNIKGTKQFLFCDFICKKYNFTTIGEYSSIGDIDLIFASEYFEHFERPVEHLIDLIEKLNPKYFIIANSFNTKSIGHFIDYKHKEETINQKYISKFFNKNLKSLGYERVKTKIFNNKPSLFIKK